MTQQMPEARAQPWTERAGRALSPPCWTPATILESAAHTTPSAGPVWRGLLRYGAEPKCSMPLTRRAPPGDHAARPTGPLTCAAPRPAGAPPATRPKGLRCHLKSASGLGTPQRPRVPPSFAAAGRPRQTRPRRRRPAATPGQGAGRAPGGRRFAATLRAHRAQQNNRRRVCV